MNRRASERLDDIKLQRVYEEIDEQLAAHDDSARVAQRDEVKEWIRDLMRRLRRASRLMRNERREVKNGA
jgi:hypothetical protein